MDNASYHNSTEESTFPKSNARKENIRKMLDDKAIPWGEDLLKAELYALYKSPIKQLGPKIAYSWRSRWR